MKKILFLLLPILLFAEGFKVEPPASWVNLFEYELIPVSIKPSQVHTQHLLIDNQRHFEEKTLFRRVAVKPLTQTGVEEVSQLKLFYNPAFSHVYVHSIRLYRNGVWHERLSTARHHLLQQEDNLEMNLFSGMFTLIFFISDVRVGDVVEYQYSYIGGNPLLTTHVYEEFYLEDYASIEHISYRLLADSGRRLLTKPFSCTSTLNVRDLSSDVREWSIASKETKASSHEPFCHIQISEYPSWKEVIDKMAPLVELPERFLSDPLLEIAFLIEDWRSQDRNEQVRLATRFVQNEIHYLSLSDGISALKPEDPTLCFMKRYGDCKDKTLLLHGLLKLMGIDSTLILVHHKEGASLQDALPSPYHFNHMILRIELEGATFFVDSTLTHQGGEIRSNYVPSYHFGLPLSSTESELIKLPDETLRHPIEIETTLAKHDNKNLEMTVVTTYYDQEAESIRRKLASRGRTKLAGSYLHYTQQLYRGATSLKPLQITDDLSKNIFSTTEHYLIPTKKRFQIQSQLLFDYLETDTTDLPLPLWIKEHIHLDLEEELTPHAMNFEHDSFIYRSTINKSDLYFEIHFPKDHVIPSEIDSFNEIMFEIESETDLGLH